MGTWGTKLYQDDVTMDIRDTYKDRLHLGKAGEDITKELINENEDLINDVEEGPLFWFALADTQWNLGRLENFVKEKAIEYIDSGLDLKRWKTGNPKEALKREKELEELKKKLLSKQPEKKKISQYKEYKCEWKIGDVYAYRIESDIAREKGLYGKYFLFIKCDEMVSYPNNVVPIVRVKITKDNKIPNTFEEINELEYVQISVRNYEDRYFPLIGDVSIKEQIEEKSKIEYKVNEYGVLPIFLLKLMNTSKRIIPSKLTYVGNFSNIELPKNEFIPHDKLSIYGVIWKFLEDILIDRYMGYNLGRYYKNK